MNCIQIGCNFISHCNMHIQHLEFDKWCQDLIHKTTHSSGFRGISRRWGHFHNKGPRMRLGPRRNRPCSLESLARCFWNVQLLGSYLILLWLMPTVYSYFLYHVNLKLKVYHILTLEILFYFFKIEKKVKELEKKFQLFHEELLILISILRGV